MTISAEQQHRACLLGIGYGSHAAKCTSSVVQSMGSDGDPGLLEWDALVREPGVWQELMHRKNDLILEIFSPPLTRTMERCID
jgi:hypothetical protein